MSVAIGLRGPRRIWTMVDRPVTSVYADSNVVSLLGPPEVLEKLFDKYPGVRFVSADTSTGETTTPKRRGRKPGSTNWTRERFWRRYRMAARDMRRPYHGTHLAARMKLTYATFAKYLGMWGPPPDVAGPGD